MWEQAARTLSRVAVVVPVLNWTTASCLPSAASNWAQPPTPAATSREPAIVRAATRRCTVHSLRSVTASAGRGDPGTVRVRTGREESCAGGSPLPALVAPPGMRLPPGGADARHDRGLCAHRRHAVGRPDQPGRVGGLAVRAP